MNLAELRLTLSTSTGPAKPPTSAQQTTLRDPPYASHAPPSQRPRMAASVPSATMSGVSSDAEQWIKSLREQHVERCVRLRCSVVFISFDPSTPDRAPCVSSFPSVHMLSYIIAVFASSPLKLWPLQCAPECSCGPCICEPGGRTPLFCPRSLCVFDHVFRAA